MAIPIKRIMITCQKLAIQSFRSYIPSFDKNILMFKCPDSMAIKTKSKLNQNQIKPIKLKKVTYSQKTTPDQNLCLKLTDFERNFGEKWGANEMALRKQQNPKKKIKILIQHIINRNNKSKIVTRYSLSLYPMNPIRKSPGSNP